MEWLGLIAALASLAGSVFTNISNRQSVQDTNAANLAGISSTNQTNFSLAQQANAWQSAEWDRQFQLQNDYNLPSNQLARYRQAGINPALAMGGNLIDATASSPSNPTSHLAAAQPFQAIAPMMQNLETSQLADVALKNAQANLANSEAAEADSRVPLHIQEARNLEETAEYTRQLVTESKAKVDLMSSESYANFVNAASNWQDTMSQIALRIKQGGLIDSESSKNSKEAALLQKELDHYEEKLQSDLDTAQEAIRQMKADAALKRKMAEEIKERIRQGKVEFAAEWGTTDAEIEMRINRALDAADVEAGILSQELARSSKTSYRRFKHFAEIWNDLVGPILSGGSDVSDAVSKQRSKKTVKKIVK